MAVGPVSESERRLGEYYIDGQMVVLALSSSLLLIHMQHIRFDVCIALTWQIDRYILRMLFGRCSATSDRTAISGHVAKPRSEAAISVLFSMGVRSITRPS